MANRQAMEVGLLEIAETLEDLLQAHGTPQERRISRQLVNALSVYARERQVIRAIERNGLDSPWAIRSLDEYRRDRQRLAATNDEPSGVA